MMLQNLDEQYRASAGLRFTLQAIITKADTIPDNEIGNRIPKMKQNIVQAAPTCLAPIITSAHLHPFFGIDEVRRAIIRACLT
jgi:GTP-binding protein